MQENKFSYIRSISSFFYILLGGQFLLAGTISGLVYFDQLDPFPWANYSGNLTLLGMGVSIICRYASNYLYKKKLNEIVDSDKPIKRKLEDYMTANIQRWAIMEFAILTCIILVYLSGSILLLVILAAMIFLFLLTWPKSKRIIYDLDIEWFGQPETNSDDYTYEMIMQL